MSRRSPVNYPDTITFRVPREVGHRLRKESVRENEALADVARQYLAAGIAAADAQEERADQPNGGHGE
jgi:hypothetical protein